MLRVCGFCKTVHSPEKIVLGSLLYVGINYHHNNATQSIFKVTSGSASTKEVMRERLKDEWLPNHNG